MAENLYVGSHRTTNKKWRDGWDETFKKPKKSECDKRKRAKKNEAKQE